MESINILLDKKDALSYDNLDKELNLSEYESLNISAYKRLKSMILSNKLEFNVLYSERKIADELEISRTPNVML